MLAAIAQMLLIVLGWSYCDRRWWPSIRLFPPDGNVMQAKHNLTRR